jgi:DNA primase
VQKQGADKFLDVLSHALDIFEFGISEWAQNAAQLSGREKSERVENFMPLLSAVTDPVIRNEAAQRIADAFRLEFDTVWSRVRGKAGASQTQAQMQTGERQARRPVPNGEKFVLTAAVQGKLTREQIGRLHDDLFEDPACKTVFSMIKTDLDAGQPIDFEKVQTHLRGDVEQTLLSELSLTEDIDDRTLERLDENLLPMERGRLDRRQQQLQRDIVDAERSGDGQRLDQLLTEKSQLHKLLSSLK